MKKRHFTLSDLKERLSIRKNSTFTQSGVLDLGSVSFNWLHHLISGLEGRKDNARSICEVFSTVVNDLSSYETIKWELARIPMSFTFRKERKSSDVLVENEVGSFVVGSEDCPEDVFAKHTMYKSEFIRTGDPVWCYYSVILAQEMGFELVKTWSEGDSLIDWIKTIVELEDPEASICVDTYSDTGDTFYMLYLPSETNVDNLEVLQHDSCPIEQIYHFICQEAPVRTKKILDQNLDSRQQVFRYLKRLEKNGRIEKIKHGVYVPV